MDAAYTGNQISTRRKAIGMTQKELAEKLYVTDKAVSKWERGINFPDLTLIETLAAVLDTTPAKLLGLENAKQDEIVSSMAELSSFQVEESQRDLQWAGWGSLFAAAALIFVYMLFGKDVRKTQYAYQILHCVILAISIGSVYLLMKYHQIRKFTLGDWGILYCAAISILIFLGFQFFTGHNPPGILSLFLIGIAAASIQFLFYRIMQPRFVKAIPSIACTLFALWHLRDGRAIPEFWLPSLCCITVICICCISKLRKSK